MELSVMAREVKMVLLPAYVIDYGSRSVGRMKAVVSGFSPQKVIGVKQHPLYKVKFFKQKNLRR